MVVPPEDVSSLTSAIELLVDDDQARLRLGKQARIYSEINLAQNAVLGRLIEQFTNTVLSQNEKK